MIIFENELGVALHTEKTAILKRTLHRQVETEALIEIPIGTIQEFPPPPREEVRQILFIKAFEHSQKVKFNGSLGVGCFKIMEEKNVPQTRKIKKRRKKNPKDCRVSIGAHVQR